MKSSARKALRTAVLILVGLSLVALAMAWARFPPARAMMIVEGLAVSLGTTPRGGVQRHSWTIRNDGSLPLKLRTRFTSGRCGFSLWLGQDYFVPAGGLLTVSLTCPVPNRAGTPYFAHAEVHTDDPERPQIRFRLVGLTGPTKAP